MSHKYKSINKIGITTIIGTIGVELVNFCLIPIMTRELGTSGYGTISIYTVWCSVIIAICGLQTTQSVVYIVAEKDPKLHKEYFASMLACSLVCFLITGLCFSIINTVFDRILGFSTFLVIALFLHSFGNYSVNFANTIFIQKQQPIKQVLLSVSIALSTALLSIWMVHAIETEESKYIGRILGYTIPYVIIGTVISGCCIIPYLKKIKLIYIKELLPLCLPIIVHSLAGHVFTQSDRVMLGYISDSSAAGIYSFAYSIASLLSVVWITVNSFYQPFFFSYMKNQDIEQVDKKTKNFIELYTCGYAVFLFLIPELMTVYGGENFQGALWYLPIITLGIYFNFLYVFNSNYEIFYKKTKNIAKATTITAIINIVLNALLIPKYSIMGAAIATLLSSIVLFLIHLYYARKISKELNVQYVFKINTFIIGSAIAVLITICFYLLQPYLAIRIVLGILIIIFSLWRIVIRKSII